MFELKDYKDRFQTVAFDRSDGILEMRLHSEGGPLHWGSVPHSELEQALLFVGRDRANEVIILTGTGDEFCGPEVREEDGRAMPQVSGPDWVRISWEVRNMLFNLLSIEVPMIGAINGPALRHAEVPLLCDIVIGTPDVVMQDSAHYRGGLVPGDGVHVAYPALMGPTRARYFMLTGEKIGAEEMRRMGMLHEIVERSQLMSRAHQLANIVLKQPVMTRRNTRFLFTERIRREMNEQLPLGLALEGLGIIASP